VKLSIRWKLILLICLPLALIYAALLTVDFIQLRSRAYVQMQRFVQLLAKEQATNFDGQFTALAHITDSTSQILSTHPQMTDQEIDKILRSSLKQHPLAFGAGIAFKPETQTDSGDQLNAHYVFRDTENPMVMKTKNLADPDYNFTDPKWQWFAEPIKSAKPVWTHPYVNTGADGNKVCTYSSPIITSDGKVIGVTYINIRLLDLQQAVEGLKEELGEVVDGFAVLDSTGTFISYPRPEVIDKTVFSMADDMNLPQLADAGKQALAGKSGVVRIKGMSKANPYLQDDKYTWIAFSPISSNDWVFAAALPERVVMAPLIQRLWGTIGFMTLGLILIFAVVFLVSTRMTRPIEQLADAVELVGQGDMRTQVGHIKSRDEIGQLARGFNDMVKQLNEHIEALTRETAAREQVESELRVGREIQTSLLPSHFPPFPNQDQFDLYAVNVAARQVAGDFFDFFMTHKDKLMLLIADVSGKGVPAALFMAVARTVIRNLAVLGHEPAEILNRANTILLADNPTSMFVTIFLAQYDIKTGHVIYANAGHPPPYVIGVQDGKVREFGKVTGPLLGVLPASQFDPYEQHTEALHAGESLVMFTDGVFEARSPEGKLFGYKRLEKLLTHYANASVKKFCKGAVAVIDRFQNNDRADDITLVILHRKK